MASGYSTKDKKYSTPSTDRRNVTPNDHYLSRSNSNNSFQPKRTNSNDSETTTLELVDNFKAIVQKKARINVHMSESDVEQEVAQIRRGANPEQCNIDEWKSNLPKDMKNCSKDILRVSMAYGNDPHEVKSIIQTKMNNTDGDENPTDTSLDNITGPLERLKKELDRNKSSNLFKDICNFDDDNIERANRLFFSEVCHAARGIKDFSYIDAQNAVQAIREIRYETYDPATLRAIIKTCHSTEDVRIYLKDLLQKIKVRDESPSSDNDNPPPIIKTSNISKPKPKNDTSDFHIKPFDDPNPTKPIGDTKSRRFHNQPQEDRSPSPPPTRNQRQQ